eukprot:gnl/TRDRNA2_/TRDRNA2_176920_c0_seq4.p1 gnl/TRDRNA2_/TRDRNA2_176920_c0~~gnl/TRDRNA2_/TRDRNA2_176920_c0_seq4.p1  ORF type:complete len:216 (-),score=43.33 gnl/TRDRNA2_/TRDRNA2_176920_c0_seq4:115-762(-)
MMRTITMIVCLSQVQAFDPSLLANSPAVRPPVIVRPAPAAFNQMVNPALRYTAMQDAPSLRYVEFKEGVNRKANYNDAKMGVGGTKPTTDGSQKAIGGMSPYGDAYPTIGERPTGAGDVPMVKPTNAYKPGPAYALTGNDGYEKLSNNLAAEVQKSADIKAAAAGKSSKLAAQQSSDAASVAAAGIISFFVGAAVTLAIFYRRAPKTSEYQLLAA